MSLSPPGILPLIVIDRTSPDPLHKQVYANFQAAIVNGQLKPNQKIPSSRELAVWLNVSRFPILEHTLGWWPKEIYRPGQVQELLFPLLWLASSLRSWSIASLRQPRRQGSVPLLSG